MKKLAVAGILSIALLASCVSKKKYVALEDNLSETTSMLTKTRVEKEELEDKFAKIEARVAEYNTKANMRNTLKNVDPAKLAQATTLQDSMNLAVSYKLQQSISDENDDVNVSIDKTVVMINISDELLFNTASYKVSNKADKILKKLAEVIKSEPSMEVMVEGHTDARTINTPMVTDNWDLSVKRATSIVRELQKKYDVNPTQLIAAGRSSYVPLVANDSKENMAKNRRTKIVILPNLDKFFALLDAETL